MTSGIIEILKENAGVIALVGMKDGQVKIYPTIGPQDTDLIPYIVVSEVSLNPALAKLCPPSLDFPRYNVLVYSTDFRETEVIQQACRDALDIGQGFTTDVGATFDSVYMVDRQDLFQAGVGQEHGLFVKLGVYECGARA